MRLNASATQGLKEAEVEVAECVGRMKVKQAVLMPKNKKNGAN